MSQFAQDYHASLRVRQGRIIAAMRANGIKTLRELSALATVRATTVSALLNFRITPRNKKTGEWTRPARRIARALCVEVSELFPEYLQHEMPTNCISSFVTAQQLAGGPQPVLQALTMENDERQQVVADVLDSLSERERAVLLGRFWEDKEYKEIGASLNLTRGRVHAIEAKALRRLRTPYNAKRLEAVL